MLRIRSRSRLRSASPLRLPRYARVCAMHNDRASNAVSPAAASTAPAPGASNAVSWTILDCSPLSGGLVGAKPTRAVTAVSLSASRPLPVASPAVSRTAPVAVVSRSLAPRAPAHTAAVLAPCEKKRTFSFQRRWSPRRLRGSPRRFQL